MCGIAGATGKNSGSSVDKMLDVIRHRGPDGRGSYSVGDITLGSVLLRITGDRSQPLTNSGALSFNGEIYNFREIAERLHIATDSDSETLFALIGLAGPEAAINELDGDYAFAYTKAGKLSLARDTAGVKPLYYGSTGESFAFASEKKALLAVGISEIYRLKPGHILSYLEGRFSEKKVTGFTTGERLTDETEASKALYNALELAVRKRSFAPSAIAFSGGLDSSFIAALSQNTHLYSVGMAGSHDLQQARDAARVLGLEDKLHFHELSEEEVESAIPLVIRAVESTDPLQVSIALPLFFASGDARNDGIRVMLSGQGADELFGGYKRYESMDRHELELALLKDLDNIAENNLERDDAVTMANSVELRVPFLDREVVELALRIAPELKIHNGVRKYILRLAAGEILPPLLVSKEKKAAQYSSGIYSALEKLSKKNGFGRKLERYLGSMPGL